MKRKQMLKHLKKELVGRYGSVSGYVTMRKLNPGTVSRVFDGKRTGRRELSFILDDLGIEAYESLVSGEIFFDKNAEV